MCSNSNPSTANVGSLTFDSAYLYPVLIVSSLYNTINHNTLNRCLNKSLKFCFEIDDDNCGYNNYIIILTVFA